MDHEAKLEELLLVMGELYDREMSTAFLATYKRVLLNAMSAEEACQGIEIVLGRKTFGFPKPWEIVEAAKGKPEDQALLAWQTLLDAIQKHGPYKSVIFEDTRITTVIEALGGWIAVCGWLEDEMPIRRSEFMKLYVAARPGEKKALPGIIEGSNAALGYLDHIPDPVVVDGPLKQVVHGKPILPSVLQEAQAEATGIPDQLREGMDGLLSRMSIPVEQTVTSELKTP